MHKIKHPYIKIAVSIRGSMAMSPQTQTIPINYIFSSQFQLAIYSKQNKAKIIE